MKNTKTCRILALVALAMAFSARSPGPEIERATDITTPAPAPSSTPALTPDPNRIASDYPKVDGSTSTLPASRIVPKVLLTFDTVVLLF